MVFSFRELASGACHRAMGMHRRLFGVPADAIARRRDSSVIVPMIDLTTKQPMTCHLCGYVLVELKSEHEWCLSGCSATQLEHLLRGQRLLDQNVQLSYNQHDQSSIV